MYITWVFALPVHSYIKQAGRDFTV
jgi:hypothetical protein